MSAPDERAEAAAAALADLQAHRIAVHVLSQHHGTAGLSAALDDLPASAAADTFARALGVIVTHLDPEAADRAAEAVRAAIPALVLAAEGGAR